MGGWYKAARGLISRDIDKMCIINIFIQEIFNTNISHKFSEFRTQHQLKVIFTQKRFLVYKDKTDLDLLSRIQFISIKG